MLAALDPAFSGTVAVEQTDNDTFVVSTLADENDGDHSAGDLSLREALALAAERSGDDVIQFDPSLNGGTITLVSTRGSLVIGSNVEIMGPGADLLTISPRWPSGQISWVMGGIVVEIGVTAAVAGLTIDSSSSYHDAGRIGGIVNNGTLTITDVTVSGNYTMYGGGIYNDGTLMIRDATISDNAAWKGGGIYNGGTLTITNSTVHGNSGGIWNDETDGIGIVHNTIVAGNGDDVFGTFDTASSHNLIGVIDGSTGLGQRPQHALRHGRLASGRSGLRCLHGFCRL